MAERGFKSWCEGTALELRRRLRLRNFDPLRPDQVAADLGVTLCTPRDIPGLSPSAVRILLGEEQDSWSAITLSTPDQDLVIYNSAHSPGRRANDIMHELAHVMRGHDPGRVMFFPDGNIALRTYDQNQEDEANWLAGCLLLPRDALTHIKAHGITEEAAARTYQVSVQLLKYRLNVTGVNVQFRRGRAGRRQ